MNEYITILLVIVMSIAVIEDVRRLKIPNWVTFPTIIFALAYHFHSGGLDGLLFSAGGLATGIGLFIIPYLMGGMGAGDAKLMGAAGAILGPEGILIVSVIVILTGGIYGLGIFALHPRYAVSFIGRLWATFKTLFLTGQVIIIPPDKDEKRLVLRYAIPIAIGNLSYVAMEITGNHWNIFDSLN